jgi:hypothetical protein
LRADFLHVICAQFWILNLATLLLAVVIGFEMYSPDKLDEAPLLARRALKLKMIAAMRDDLLRLSGSS